MEEFMSILAGLAFALTSVSGKLALKNGATASQTTLMTLLVSVPLFALLLFLSGFPQAQGVLLWQALGWFSAAGIVSSLMARIMYFKSIGLIGPSRLTQLVATDSLFAIVFAFVLIGQHLSPSHIVAIVLITVGVFLIGSERREEAPTEGHKRLTGTFLGLGCGALYALRSTFIGMGLILVPSPIWGAFVGNFIALFVYLAYLMFTHHLSVILPKQPGAIKWSVMAGLSYFAAWVTMFYALVDTQVAVVAALKNIAPLFSMGLSWLMIGKEEHLSGRVVVSCSLMILGVLVTL